MELDPPRLLLLKLIGDTESDLANVSREVANKNHAYLQQYIRRGTPRVLPEDVREKLGEHFGVNPDDFRPPRPRLSDPDVPRSDLVEIGGNQYALLPVFDLRLSMGPGAWHGGHDDEPLHFEPYRHQWLRSITAAPPEALMIARVEGDSMESTLRNGDQVLIDRTRRQATRDGIYGFRRGDELHVKRVAVDLRTGVLTIISDNTNYPRLEGVDPDTVEIIGRVIWLGRQV